ncbi:hypothetical protein [Vibrio algarum]|uniref:Uncharacterized protein n=1 Tax=Vibrio algarum TaxID=3020714 RepID=A0ABT4YTY8_9VIBR|nr:hypothetical protein [Vibrio sp. KJ40-1]MDB1124998.1 hypothetical protein [Vibrio sp. KJ40-1]
MASLGATVVGADPLEGNITLVRFHAQQSRLDNDYRHSSTNELIENTEFFNVVLNVPSLLGK